MLKKVKQLQADVSGFNVNDFIPVIVDTGLYGFYASGNIHITQNFFIYTERGSSPASLMLAHEFTHYIGWTHDFDGDGYGYNNVRRLAEGGRAFDNADNFRYWLVGLK